MYLYAVNENLEKVRLTTGNATTESASVSSYFPHPGETTNISKTSLIRLEREIVSAHTPASS